MIQGSIDPRFDVVKEEDFESNAAEEDVVDPDLEENIDEDDIEGHEVVAGGPVDMDEVD